MCAETENKCSKIVWEGIKDNRHCWRTEDGREWYSPSRDVQSLRMQGMVRDGKMCEIGYTGGGSLGSWPGLRNFANIGR